MKVEQTSSSHTVVRTALLHDICQLGQALTFFKHECLHLPKAEIGRKGYCILFCLFTFKIRSCSLGEMPCETSYRVWAYLHYSILGYNSRNHLPYISKWPWIGDVVLVLDITASPTR